MFKKFEVEGIKFGIDKYDIMNNFDIDALYSELISHAVSANIVDDFDDKLIKAIRVGEFSDYEKIGASFLKEGGGEHLSDYYKNPKTIGVYLKTFLEALQSLDGRIDDDDVLKASINNALKEYRALGNLESFSIKK